MKDYRNTNMNYEARGAEPRRRGPGTGRLDRRFAKRLFSMLMVVSLLCNAFGFVVDDFDAMRQMGVNRPASAESAVISSAAKEANGAPGELELDADAMDAYDDTLDHIGDLDISQDIASNSAGDDNVYTYKLDDETKLVLSDLVKQLKLPIKRMDLIENVSLLGNEKDPAIDMSLFITIVAVEDDYLIFLKPQFADAKLLVYTADKVFTIRLVNDMTLDLEDVRKAALKLEQDPSARQSVFRCDFDHNPARIRLSKLLDQVGLSINVKNVQDVGVLERKGNEGGTLAIKRVKNDYDISAMKRFAEIDLAVFTADNTYTIALLNGEPVETGASEQTNVGYEEDQEIDLSNPFGNESDGDTAPELGEQLDVDGQLELDLIGDLVSDPIPEPEQEPASEPVTEPETEPAAQPEDEPEQEPAAESVAEPEQEPAVEPMPEPETEPVAQPEGEPEEPVVEPMPEPETEPVAQPEDEPEQEPVVEPVAEPEQEPASEPEQEPVAEPDQ